MKMKMMMMMMMMMTMMIMINDDDAADDDDDDDDNDDETVLFFQLFMLGLGVMYTRQCLGYLILGLTLEVGSIFLHMRSLLLMYDVSINSLLFKSTNAITIILFIGYRIPVLIFSFLCTYLYPESVYLQLIANLTISGLLIVNVMVLGIVWKSEPMC